MDPEIRASLIRSIAGLLFRAVLVGGGAIMVYRGQINNAQASQLIGDAMALGGVLWSAAQKWYSHEKQQRQKCTEAGKALRS